MSHVFPVLVWVSSRSFFGNLPPPRKHGNKRIDDFKSPLAVNEYVCRIRDGKITVNPETNNKIGKEGAGVDFCAVLSLKVYCD